MHQNEQYRSGKNQYRIYTAYQFFLEEDLNIYLDKAFSIFFATRSADAGFCPVIRLPS